MRKDIDIPEVKDVHIAVIKQKIENSKASEWIVYVLNNKNESIDILIIVSHGHYRKKSTSTLRKTINILPKKSFSKLEILPEDLFELHNEYKVSFFQNNKLYDKTFTFKKGSIRDSNLVAIPLLEEKGILAE